MTQLHRTRAKFSESLINSFVHLRAILVNLGGSHVAIWALFACNLMFGLYLMIARQTLFGEPVSAHEFSIPFAPYLWNKFTDSSDVLLMSLATALFLGLRFRFVEIVWWAAAFSASVWITVWGLAWLAYVFGYAPLASICLTGAIPVGLSIFTCLRVSADSSDLTHTGMKCRRTDDGEDTNAK